MAPSSHFRPALRLIHYWWPVAMGVSTVIVIHRATGTPVDAPGMALLLCGILAAYSVDRIIDQPPIPTTWWLRPTLLAAVAIVGVAGAFLLTLMPLRTVALVPALGVLVLAYPRLKTLPLLKTVLVATAWTWASIALPFNDGSFLGWRAWTVPVAIPLTLLIASGCLLCDLKDAQTDRDASIPSMPVLIGPRGTTSAAMALAGLGAVVALIEHRFGLSICGLGLGAAAMYPNMLSRDIVGPLLVDMILTTPGLLIALHIV